MKPLFTIATAVWDTPADQLAGTIASVKGQLFTGWEWVLVDNASTNRDARHLVRAAAAGDRRIRVIERQRPGSLEAVGNDAVRVARGDFLVFLDAGDTLARGTLQIAADAIAAQPDVDFLYSDEDRLFEDGRRGDPFRKGEWSPERLRCQNYVGHLSIARARLVRAVGAYRSGFEGAEDHDLVLRVTERARRVVHLAHLLYHRRANGPGPGGDAGQSTRSAGCGAVAAHLARVGIGGTVDPGRVAGTYRIARDPLPGARVSVVIPTRGSRGRVWGTERVLVLRAVRSLLQKAGTTPVEVVVVYDLDTPSEVLAQLRAVKPRGLVLVPFRGPFNFSAKCNAGFTASTGNVIVLMNDDLEIISEGFVDTLIGPLGEDDVGMTGARLLFSDATIQHAGLSFSTKRLYHVYRGRIDEDPGPFGALAVNREASGLTAACVALRRETYSEVGGLTEALPVNFNDVDLSYKVRAAGKRLVWLADARAYHFESQTRQTLVRQWEPDIIHARWNVPEQDLYIPELRS
jgi:glycosyltransferase involved in cell wall biosynthesis